MLARGGPRVSDHPSRKVSAGAPIGTTAVRRFHERGPGYGSEVVDRKEAHMPGDVPGGVVKVIELVGSSPNSFSDAVRNAVKTASETIRNIRGVEVLTSSADVGENGELSLYKVNCKIAFLIERGSVA
jgi:flavin-binding protein dodecin